MTPRNIAIFAVAVILGLFLGLRYPLIGLLCLVVAIGFVIFVLMRNKQGATVDDATAQAARGFQSAAGQARIYVMRKGFVGGMQGLNVTITGAADGQGPRLDGQIRSGYFLMADVAPGSHRISARMSSQTESSRRDVEVTLAAGDALLLDVSMDMGALQGKLVFDEIRDPTLARQKLAGLKMVEWLPSAAPA